MTPETYKKLSDAYDMLSDNEKRIKIIELCGHRLENLLLVYDFPDYTKDLNAMHEAEKMIPDGKRKDYRNYIFRMWRDTGIDDGYGWGHATAEQRAKAFVLTMENNG